VTRRLDTLEALDRAQTSAAAVIARLGEDDWQRRTPCDEWTVRDIVNKMVASTVTFTCFGRRARPEPPLDLVHPMEMLGADPLGTYLAEAAECRRVWRMENALEGNAPSTIGDFPAKSVLNARIFDTTILTWDVATACGITHGIDDDLAAYVMRVARALVPAVRAADRERYKDPSELDESAPLVEQMIAATGRDPHWRP